MFEHDVVKVRENGTLLMRFTAGKSRSLPIGKAPLSRMRTQAVHQLNSIQRADDRLYWSI